MEIIGVDSINTPRLKATQAQRTIKWPYTYSLGIFILWVLLNSTHAQTIEQTQDATPPYIDQLIDPNISEDQFDDINSQQGRTSRIHHDIELKQLFEEPSNTNKHRSASGINWTAYTTTNNFGNFLLNASLIDNTDYTLDNAPNADQYQSGLGRWSLRQIELPLSESLSIDNYLGAHRLQSQDRYAGNYANRRFTSVLPEIEGLTSTLYYQDTDLTLSHGRLGQHYGTLYPGFNSVDRTLTRVQGRQALKHHLISAEYWQAIGDESLQSNTTDDTNGYKLTLDSLWSNHWLSSATALSNNNSLAALLALEQTNGRLRQDFGGYYFQDNIIWLDRQISNDNAGIYYRMSNRRSALTYGAAIEYRTDGLEQQDTEQQSNQKDTTYLNFNLGRRLSRQSRTQGFYSYRNVEAEQIQNSYTEHYLRGVLNLRQNKNLSHSLSYNYRQRQNATDALNLTYQSLRLGQTYTLKNDSSLDLSLEGNREQQQNNVTTRYNAQLGWQREFDLGKSLRTEVGYHHSNATTFRDQNSWFANVSHHWPLKNNLILNTQISYNKTLYTLDQTPEQQDDLITATPAELDDGVTDDNTQSWSFLFTLRYTLGGQNTNNILAPNPGQKGSGRIKGRLFIDKNLDGIYQTNEKGLANIDVFLNSIYPTKTDANGEFSYPAVGTGKHHIFVDESTMPLPWTLNGQEYIPIEVNLRKSTRLDIPLSDQYTLPDDSLSVISN